MCLKGVIEKKKVSIKHFILLIYNKDIKKYMFVNYIYFLPTIF